MEACGECGAAGGSSRCPCPGFDVPARVNLMRVLGVHGSLLRGEGGLCGLVGRCGVCGHISELKCILPEGCQRCLCHPEVCSSLGAWR